MTVPAQAQQFGGSLAVGDEDIFVGETRNVAFPGVVYVFHRADDGAWMEAAQLTPSDMSDKADGFGRALAAEEVPDAIDTMIGVYRRERGDGETFLQVIRRVGVDPFKGALYGVD